MFVIQSQEQRLQSTPQKKSGHHGVRQENNDDKQQQSAGTCPKDAHIVVANVQNNDSAYNRRQSLNAFFTGLAVTTRLSTCAHGERRLFSDSHTLLTLTLCGMCDGAIVHC